MIPTQHNVFSGRIFFDHIPKTAGTAISNWLIDNLGDGTVTPPSMLSGPHLDLISKFGGLYPVITGHSQFLLGDDLDPRWVYVTVLRHPIERCLSWMFYLLGDVPEGFASNLQIKGARLFYDSDGAEATPEFLDGVSNIYVKHFSSINSGGEDNNRSIIENAIYNISRYKLVGFQDDLNSFMSQLAFLVGLKNWNPLKKINSSTLNSANKYISQKLVDALVGLNDLDVLFYMELQKKRVRHVSSVTSESNNDDPHCPICNVEKYKLKPLAIDLTNRFFQPYVAFDSRGKLLLSNPIGHLCINESIFVSVYLHNQSSQVWGDSIFYPVNFSYHWLYLDESVCIYDGVRTCVKSYPLTLSEHIVKVTAPPKPGKYILVISLVQEGLFWFEEKDTDFIPVKVDVEVMHN